jgi:glycosyltransferase involved in cell wall biosynthesis
VSEANRILFVNSGLRYGGAETQLLALIRELKLRGHEPSLYLLTRDAPRLGELADLGVPVVVDDKKSRLDLAVVARLREHIRRLRPDVVHGFLFDANVFARLAALGLDVPVLNSERSHGYRLTRAQAAIHRVTRRRVDGVVANSHAGREFAREMFGLPGTRAHVVWNGIDLAAVDARRGAPRPDYRHEFFGDSKVRLATLVGTIQPQKDPLLALEVAERLIDADPCWRVALVGTSYDSTKLNYSAAGVRESGELERAVLERWRRSPHVERIRFVGQRSDALEIIAASDALFSTSVQEGFPNVVLEAMAVGTPVVSTEYSDIRLILVDPRWGVGSRDPQALAEAILVAADERGRVGPALREWIERHATIARSVDSLLKVYQQYIVL